MRLRDLMQPRVITIDAGEPASTALSRMRQHRIRHLVVTSNGKLAGIVSQRDVGGPLRANVRKNRSVADLMNPRVVSAPPTMPLGEAANLMRNRRLGCLPVVEDDGRLVGIVTATDVLDELGRGAVRMTESRRQTRRRKLVQQPSSSEPVGRARPRQPESPGRTPFAPYVPRPAKTEAEQEAPRIAAYIRAAERDLSKEERAYIRRKLGRRLGKFADSIERVSVRTEDVNGPKGGVDRVCRIKVVLSGLPSVVFEARDVSLMAAVDAALAGVEMAVRRAVQRRRMKPLRRAA